jgi:hypothetical protein
MRILPVGCVLVVASCDLFQYGPEITPPITLAALPSTVFILNGLEAQTVEFFEPNSPEVVCCAGVEPCEANTPIRLATIRPEVHGPDNPFNLNLDSFVSLYGPSPINLRTVLTWGPGGLSPNVPEREVRTRGGVYTLADFENTCDLPLPFDVTSIPAVDGGWFDGFFFAIVHDTATCVFIGDGNDEGNLNDIPEDPEVFVQRCFTRDVWELGLRLDAGCRADDEACVVSEP